uniref:Cytochrome P450 3A14 n=1 Tax=Cacopsylla melanoneura TaxID=428564 RepID=A0A8D8X152_9HEMI
MVFFKTLLVYFLSTVFLFVAIHVWKNRRYYYLGSKIPRISLREIFHFLVTMSWVSVETLSHNIMELYARENSRLKSPVFSMWYGTKLVVVFTDPDLIKKTFNYQLQKDSQLYSVLFDRGLQGKNVLTENQLPKWHVQRKKITAAAFNLNSIKSHLKIMHEEANILANKMAEMAATGESFEHIHMVNLEAFATILRTLCDVDLEIQQNFHHEHPFTSAVDLENKRAAKRIQFPWMNLKEFQNLISETEIKNRQIFRALAEDIVDIVKGNILRGKDLRLADKKENNTQHKSTTKEFSKTVSERNTREKQESKSKEFPEKIINGNARRSDDPKSNKFPVKEVVVPEETFANGRLDSKSQKFSQDFSETNSRQEQPMWKEAIPKESNNTKQPQSFIETIIRDQLNPDIPKENVMSRHDLVTEILIILLAGMDTTKTATAMIMIMLGLHQDIQKQVYEEIVSVLGDDPNMTPTYHQLQGLHILTRVIKETLRLYPSIHMIARQSEQEITVAGYTIPKGVGMYAIISGLHRDPHYWGPNADQFNPDRFLPSTTPAQDSPDNQFGQKAFLAFSTGPRNCLGYKLAMMSMKLTMVALLRRFTVLPGDKCRRLEDIRCEFGITMDFVSGANDIRLEPRYT